MLRKIRNIALGEVLFGLAIVLSLCSQIASPGGFNYNYLWLKYFWALPGLYFLIRCPQYVFASQVRWIWWIAFAFVAYLFCLQTFIPNSTYLGADAMNLVISSLVAIVSYSFWRKFGSNSNFKVIIAVTFVSTVVAAIISYVNVLQFASVSQLSYVKLAKNSLGTILLCAIVLGFVGYRLYDRMFRMVIIVGLAILAIIMFMLKSRASLLGLFFVVGYIVLKRTKMKHRITAVAAIIAAIIAVLSIPEYYEVIVENILFANRDASDADSLSSGRLTFMSEVVVLIPDNLYFGVGVKYMDCFPLMQLVQFGFFGAAIVLIYLIKVIQNVNFRFNRLEPMNLATFLLFWSFMINSLFEAQAPFGPGVKCFILWMMFGFSMANYHKQKRYMQKTNSFIQNKLIINT